MVREATALSFPPELISLIQISEIFILNAPIIDIFNYFIIY